MIHRKGTPGTGRSALVALGAIAGLAAGCGGEQVPTDARLSISPAERTIRITERRDADGACRTDGSRFVDVPVLLSLVAANGSPIRDAEVSVYVGFAANTYSGHPVLSLYEDRNGNGVVDADTELASAATDSIARVRTDSDGAHRLLLRADIGCPYKGEVFAYVGTANASSSFAVEAAETIEPEPEAPQPEVDVQESRDDADRTDGDDGIEGDDGVPGPEGETSPERIDPFETLPGQTDGPEPDAEPQPVRCAAADDLRTSLVCEVDADDEGGDATETTPDPAFEDEPSPGTEALPGIDPEPRS